ncbi:MULTISPECIES: DoxX family protein [Nocardiopsis]|uniref:Transmembrane invasion protein n=1 Tax=Nocardiopsis sinuspersici TaxID=501010 RepID=A0A1V3C4Z9_9ACTN|nr:MULTISPECIES: DoxX family protein [Nocardiopsis]OOC55763.1 transmembrane invasion protein [Nocardiopsis sinuspersici]
MNGGVPTALAVVTATCALANALIVVADLSRARFVLANAAEVGLSPAAIPRLAALKGAGAVGLAVGLAGVAWLGLAAAVGLVLFFTGAVVAHVRAGVLHNIGFPLLYLALAAGALAHFARNVL